MSSRRRRVGLLAGRSTKAFSAWSPAPEKSQEARSLSMAATLPASAAAMAMRLSSMQPHMSPMPAASATAAKVAS